MDTCKEFKWQTRKGRRKDHRNDRRGDFGSSATLVGQYVWVIGGNKGESSFFVLDVVNAEWESFSIKGSTRIGLVQHSVNLFRDKMFIYGVESRRNLDNGHWYKPNEVFVFDPVLKEVDFIPTYGGKDRPNFKQSHTGDICESLNTLVLFFGGAPQTVIHQLWLLDLLSYQWVAPKIKGRKPPLRKRHASCIAGMSLYIYSGQGTGIDLRCRDLYVVKLRAREHLVWHEVKLQGNLEHGRVGPDMVGVGSGRILVFGGYSNGRNTNDLIVVQLNDSSREARCSMVMPQIDSLRAAVGSAEFMSKGSPAPGRECPRLVFGHKKVFVFGGNTNDGLYYFELSVV